MNELNVLYTTDEFYSQHAAASIYSLLNTNKDFDKINIYIIDDDIKKETKDKLQALANDFNNAVIIFYPFEKIREKIPAKDKSSFAKVGYARLFVSEMCDKDRILYIDSDTVINTSLRELWEYDLEGKVLGGVQDNPALFTLKTVGLASNDRYINSGVLLIDLNKWREFNTEEKFIAFIDKHKGFVTHHDQGIINGVLKDNIKILPPKFNTMSQFFDTKANQIKSLYDIENYYTQKELDEAVENPVIIHYLTKFYNRPWFKSCTHPLKDLYIKNLEKTPFEVKLSDGELPVKIKLRKFIFTRFPFFIYAFCERILDIKRKINIYKN
ncbi:MAG: glycosyltransferase family 8 protein [Ruminococcaceae bacterium]|nr:glycosyltransferase family 8 protein [Oscillospiraceae bacterium]